MKREEFEAYRNIPLYDQPKNYVQIIANPKVKNGFITVEDVENLPVTVDNATCQKEVVMSNEAIIGCPPNIPCEH